MRRENVQNKEIHMENCCSNLEVERVNEELQKTKKELDLMNEC